MPYHEPVTATLMGITTGLASAVVQANAIAAPNPMVVPIVSAVVGGLMSFAVLKTSLRYVERKGEDIERKVDDISTRVARIEGKLEAGE